MGICMNPCEPQAPPQKSKVDTKSKIQDVDVVKIKLKQSRDSIKNFIQKKQKDVSELDVKIKQVLPEYQQTGNKKKIIPLLSAKKQVLKMIDNADVRLKLVNEKLSQVELQQLDVDTINVLDESNQYIKGVQADLEKKDWRSIIQQSKNKMDIDWGERQDIEEDQDFQAMWKQLGGDKIPAKKTVNVNVDVNTNQNVNQQKGEVALA